MSKDENNFLKFSSISDAHRAFGLPAPKHPLVSLLSGPHRQVAVNPLRGPHVLPFYKISYKLALGGKLNYGQHYYDFDGGGLLFAAPGQVLGSNGDDQPEMASCDSYTLLLHPDFFLGHPLAKKIKQYGRRPLPDRSATDLFQPLLQTTIHHPKSRQQRSVAKARRAVERIL